MILRWFQRESFASRAIRVLVIAWMLSFLLGIGPGHTRGVVQLSLNGARPAAASLSCDAPVVSSLRSCCANTDAPGGPPKPAGHCAICKIIATLDVPPTLLRAVPVLVGLFAAADRLSDATITHDFDRAAPGRAPPALG